MIDITSLLKRLHNRNKVIWPTTKNSQLLNVLSVFVKLYVICLHIMKLLYEYMSQSTDKSL